MQNLARRDDMIWPARSGISLAGISRSLDVPVVIATTSDAGSLRTHSTFGLDFGVNWSEFAAAIDALCTKGATIIPNIEAHPELSRWSGTLVTRNIRFLAGMPLCDADGWRAGSIAVIANQQAVARKGVAIRRLGEFGRQFVGIAG
jgi:hypothetical protein